MKKITCIVLILTLVFTGITTPSFAQFQIRGKGMGNGSIGMVDKSQVKVAQKEAKKILKEIKVMDKEYQRILSESCPEKIKERQRYELQTLITQYNAFAADLGLEPYETHMLELPSNDSSQGKTSRSNDEMIVLTVSSDGATKDEAIKNALRTAIEQAYGAFVSANTTILNDELVKDEIVTVSNGSIKEYKEIASAQMPNGSYNVTLSATVSLPNLITYAKNHGSECEFAGNTFGMEMRLFDLQKANERKAILNLNTQLRGLLPNLINWKMEMAEPRVPSSHLRDDVIYDESFARRLATLKDGTINQSLFEKIKAMRFEDFYVVSADIYAIMPKNDIIGKTLEKLSISKAEYDAYTEKGLKLGSFNYSNPEQSGGFTDETLFFRNEDIKQLMDSIYGTVAQACSNFVITDNLGNHHYLYPNEIKASTNQHYLSDGIYHGDNINVYPGDYRSNATVVSLQQDTLFSYPVTIYSIGNYYDGFNGTLKGIYYTFRLHKSVSTYPLGGICFYIPRDEIGKYSSFKIGPKE